MKTREQALDDLRRIVAEQGRVLDTLTPEEAAERAYRPGGPSRAELAAEFAETRCRLGGVASRAGSSARFTSNVAGE